MNNNTKKCTKCKFEKSFIEFNKCKTGKYGLHNHCRKCQKDVRRQWYVAHAEIEIKKASVYSKSEKCIKKRKEQYEKNKDKLLERNRIARCTPHARRLANIAKNKRYANNPSFRLSANLRGRIRSALKGIAKLKSSLELLGCTIDELKIHLESKFLNGMTWENYSYRGWHVDHIVPCASFDLSKPEAMSKCFHWTNLQPLWCKDNISKGSKIPTHISIEI